MGGHVVVDGPTLDDDLGLELDSSVGVEAVFEEPGVLGEAVAPYATPGDVHVPNGVLGGVGGDVRRAMLDAMDCGIGKVLEAVADLNQNHNTLVIFVGDNGGYRDTSNGKLRGEKGRWFEGGIRVPFIFSWPGQLPEGKTYDHPVMHIDILPTVLAVAGGDLPNNLDGENLLPFLRAERSEPS